MTENESLPAELIYEGSVKKVWSCPSREDRLWFEFTDDYSVFDWGKMPDQISNKGRALALMGAFLFDKLSKPETWRSVTGSPVLEQFDEEWLQLRFNHPVCSADDGLLERGLSSHFKALTYPATRVTSLSKAANSSESLYMEVLKAEVTRPEAKRILGQKTYFYDIAKATSFQRRLIPLEVVFRFGMPEGSSLAERLQADPDYRHVLGLRNEPQPGQYFDHPVLEFYTKLEPKDRLLTLQEAIQISSLSSDQFENLCEIALDCALALFVIFAERKVELWDGKFEFIIDNGEVFLADSIGPDELRLKYKNMHLSKESIRQVYRTSQWYDNIKEAQRLAASAPMKDWREICKRQLKSSPEPLSANVKEVVDKLYGVIANTIIGAEVFRDHPLLDDFTNSMASLVEQNVAAAQMGAS